MNYTLGSELKNKTTSKVVVFVGLIFPFQDMGHDIGPAAADILGHAEFRIGHLGTDGLTAKLLNHFDDLVHPGGAHWMPPGLEPAAGSNGDCAVHFDFAFFCQ